MTPLTKLIEREVVQGGNSLFNALASGFIDLLLADNRFHLSVHFNTPLYTKLIEAIIGKLNLGEVSWEIYIQYLAATVRNPKKLQSELGHLLRALAVELHDEKKTLEMAQEEFREFVFISLERYAREEIETEEPFRRIPFISRQFESLMLPLYSCNGLSDDSLDQLITDVYLPQLTEWWKAEGYRQYLSAMSSSDTWGTSLEIGVLAKALDIEVIINRKQTFRYVNGRNNPHIYLRNPEGNLWIYQQDIAWGRLKFDPDDDKRPLYQCIADSNAVLRKKSATHRYISAHGDGNCSFNGFALGFCDRLLSGALDAFLQLPHYQRLLKDGCQAFKLDAQTWETLKKFVHDYREFPLKLQIAFSPLFRHYAAELYENQDLLPALQAEFREYAYKLLGIPLQERGYRGGDIFKRIPLIVKHFATYSEIIHGFALGECDLSVLDEVIVGMFEPISEWWALEGFSGFKDQMNHSGEWAGDMELGYLGAIFNINVKLVDHELFRSINESYGYLPLDHGFSDEVMVQLKQRCIIKQSPEADGRYAFREVSSEQLKTRLAAMAFHEDILNYFIGLPETGELDPTWVPMLLERDLIMKDKGRYRFIEDIDFNTLFSRVCELEGYGHVIELHAQHYKQHPCLAFSNPLGGHWYYVQEKALGQLCMSPPPSPPRSPRYPRTLFQESDTQEFTSHTALVSALNQALDDSNGATTNESQRYLN